MQRSQLLLVGELTRALCFRAPAAVTEAAITPAGPTHHAVALNRQVGTITEWDPFERHGVVEDKAGRRYRIANTRAFETVLPTMLRTLEGAVVEFDVDEKATADRVIIRSRLTPITAESYRQKPPVNFLSPEMLTHLKPVRPSSSAGVPAAESARLDKESVSPSKTALPENVVLYAKNITVDISSIPAKQIARWSGPLSHEEVIKPTKNLKDMRSSRLFDPETNAYLKLRQQLGSSEEAKRLLAEQRERAQASAIHREVVAEKVSGVILAWSGIHRSGLLRELRAGESIATTTDAVTASGEDDANNATLCIIRNVYAFQSALPTSQSLLDRRVTFTKVTYSAQPNRFFAENIAVAGELTYDNAVSSLEEAQAAKQKERAAALRTGRPSAYVLDDSESGAGGTAAAAGGNNTTATASSAADTKAAEADAAGAGGPSPLDQQHAEPPVDPQKVYYGVVVRWSGGQGVVEGGDGGHYYLRSAADFVQLVDQSSHQLRGAVVQFKRDPESPRYAREVDILSTATTPLMEVKPLVERKHVVEEAADGAKTFAPASASQPPRSSGAATDVEPDGVEWVYGTLLSWSPVEAQGIVVGDGEEQSRYVLRDPDENVIAYAAKQHLLKKGRQVKFTTFGSTGRLVCNLVLLETETEEATLEAAELRPKEPSLSMDGNMNEAIPSPMSTSYWLNRMDKAGYDTREVKDMQNRALTLDEDEDDDGTEGGKFLDSEELLKKDHWWNDPRKNIRFPNSDMTAGHLALIGPASMMNVAMKTKDPKKLDKMLKKYQSRLTEDQKEYAWKQAKDMAPKYEECVRKGRERNEEPKFYFF